MSLVDNSKSSHPCGQCLSNLTALKSASASRREALSPSRRGFARLDPAKAESIYTHPPLTRLERSTTDGSSTAGHLTSPA
ncbi:hypothetical protein PCANC_13200 [Puccinia coronata f. sp. avenae]|uniref:Uncharacterized protein n=1 Tax=Puccinia coronata f. sp. avenae TaxID=200324 RepID=A0A2N5V057_9BASI|nr:hypothetical protein PCASD_24456 [Puccinia coronata f. sp. avenae]PLW17106.1 hypothetical protein PCANC_14615 [Puccinia coronata f. sp. avenae]PLW43388.1 hypothetical protein PCANC_13200 [Puccinia coronata f. sp. avenae]